MPLVGRPQGGPEEWSLGRHGPECRVEHLVMTAKESHNGDWGGDIERLAALHSNAPEAPVTIQVLDPEFRYCFPAHARIAQEQENGDALGTPEA